MSDTEVLIVGAGPTGLTLACVLARRGIPFRLVDAAPAPPTGSRAKGAQPRSLEVFDDLGIIDEVVAHGRFYTPMRFHDGHGHYRDQDARTGREPRPDTPYAAPLMTPQWRIEAALRQRLASYGGEAAFGLALKGLEQDETGVAAILSGPDGDEQLRAAWLVGCDGGRSTTRRLLGVDFVGGTFEEFRMLVADVRVTGLDRDHWHVWRNDAGFLALCPLPDTEVFQYQASLGPGDPTEATPNLYQDIVDARGGDAGIRVSDPGWHSIWRANVRMVERYRVGRALLAGDAAHVHSPAGGQGMNTGIQDAYNLGWKLAAVLGGADAGLIDTYEEERLPIAAGVLGLSNRLSLTAFQQAPRDDETLQLGLNYRDRRLSQELRAEPGGVRAGDRAPDAPGLLSANGSALRLFDLFRGAHVTLLAFGQGWDEVIAETGLAFGPKVKSVVIGPASAGAAREHVLDAQGHAARIYDIRADTLLIVRPDGYVGLAADQPSVAPILAYLRQIVG